MSSVSVFDPTVSDSLSRARGIGRYLKIMQHALANSFLFTENLTSVNRDGVFINPFFDPLKTPTTMRRLSRLQIAVIHDLIPLKYPSHFPVGLKGKLNIFFNSLAIKNYDLIVTDSEASKRDIVRILGIGEERIRIIYPAILPSEAGESKDLLEGKPYILYVGDATWNKNLVAMAKAVKKTNVVCVCVGRVFEHKEELTHSWQQELKEFLHETANDPHFIFPGYVDEAALSSYYRHATANVLVSRDEGFGFSFFEAALHRTPSILSDTPIFHETAREAGVFTDPNSPDEIAAAIQKLMSDEGLRKKVGTAAYERTATFTLERFRQEWLAVTET